MKLHEVYPRLFIRGRLSISNVPELREGGYTVVALACADPFIAALLDANHYVDCAIPDGMVSKGVAMQVNLLADDLARRWERGEKLIIHCRAGRNRAAFVAALVLNRITSRGGRYLVDHLREVRPNALANPHFVDFLTTVR